MPLTSTGWKVCGLALLATLVSGALVLRAREAQPRREVELGGLRLRMERALWLHEPTDHGDVTPLPSSRGGPGPAERRLSVELSLFNPLDAPLDFNLQELSLSAVPRPEDGAATLTPALSQRERELIRVQPKPASVGSASLTLGPSELLPLTVSFDVPSTTNTLRLEWVRGEARETLLFTRRPPSAAPPPPRWPRRVEELPPGNARAGSLLFHGRVACVSCHGSPTQPHARRIAPSLDDFAQVGASRVTGLSAAQYAYESLLNPSAFIAPECADSTPCAQPSTMPLYGDVLSQQEMADLVSYLVGLRVGG